VTNKGKGTAFETLILGPARAYYPDAIRAPLSGTKDIGDLWLPGERRFVVEAKHHTRLDLAGWAAEAEREARNKGVPFWVIPHKRVGKGKGEDQWLTTTWGQFLALANDHFTS
jgi:hypothetical protein